jgi:conflict system STAND superfamily ATPase
MGQGHPFIGPRPFEEADAKAFFGRENEIAALTAEVVSTQIVLLYASSGSGKSSLINAGLIPAMRSEGFKASQARLNTLVSGDSQRPVDLLCEAVRNSALQSSTERPSLLVLDQFEEIIVAATYTELFTLAETVYSTMAENLLARIVISFREEYLARVDALFNRVTEASVVHFHLDRLSRPGALEAFDRSLDTVGFQVEPEAAELFLQKLAPPTERQRSEVGFEPLYLQLLGSQLWSSISNPGSTGTSLDADGRSDVRPVVTVTDVRLLVDFDQAIEIFYNSTISQVCESHHLTQKTMRDWIDRELVTADETRSMVRRQLDETEGLPTSALDDLVKQGLLRTEPRGEDLWIELAHDQLVERVREFNRIWWDGRMYTRLRHRDTRYQIAAAASNLDLQRWLFSRIGIWNLASGVRESGIQLSRRYGRLLPFAKKRPQHELDRLALRAFVLGGTLVNTAFSLYRSATTPYSDVPETLKVTGIEGLDAEAAKRRLQATALNLGDTTQLLGAANVFVTAAWARLLSRLLTRSAIGAQPANRRRWLYVGVLFGTDAGLTLLRWAVRNGVIKNCLDPAGQMQRALGGAEVVAVRRCMNLEDAASWSRDRPVLLVLDWRSKADGTRAFERFLNQEVPLYEKALRARGAITAWCCRADVQRRGWRDGISGIGLPSRDERTYYMIERGNVVAWRMVRYPEFPVQLQANSREATGSVGGAQAQALAIQTEKRFIEILTSLIVSSEARPPWSWLGEAREGYFRAGLRRRNRKGHPA